MTRAPGTQRRVRAEGRRADCGGYVEFDQGGRKAPHAVSGIPNLSRSQFSENLEDTGDTGLGGVGIHAEVVTTATVNSHVTCVTEQA